MENFFYDDEFFSDLGDLLDHLEIDESNVQDLPDDWSKKLMDTNLEPMFQFDMEGIQDALIDHTDRWDDRFPEDAEHSLTNLRKAIKASVNLEALNSAVPKLYYPADKELIVTKADLLNWII